MFSWLKVDWTTILQIRNEFGSTKCYEIWRFNFSDKKDLESYISGHSILQCDYIAKKVTKRLT